MSNQNEENNLIRLSPTRYMIKNNSFQTSISKDLPTNNKSSENIISSNMNNSIQTINNLNKYVHILNFNKIQHKKNNFSSLASLNIPPHETDKGSFTNTMLKGSLNFNPLMKKVCYQTIKLKPKRNTDFPSLKLRIQGNKHFFRNGKIDIEKPLSQMKLENNIKSSDNIMELYKEKIYENLVNKEFTITNKKVINFKSEQIKLFSKISGDYTNFKKFVNFINERHKLTLNFYLSQLSNLIEIQRNVLFIDNANYSYFESKIKDQTLLDKNINTNTSNVNIAKPKENKKIIIDEQKVHNLFNNKTMIKYLKINSEYNSYLYKCFDLIFNELKELKEKNMELLKANYENDILLNSRNKELKDIQKLLNSNQAKEFFESYRKKEDIVKNMGLKYNKKESKYLLDLYNLNYEMKELILLLNKNKEYYNKCKELEEKGKQSFRENMYMKAHLTSQLEKNKMNYKNEVGINIDLNEHIVELEEDINKLKNKNEEMVLNEIQLDSKIKRLNDIINEKNENLRMMKEEMDYYYIRYKREILSHEATKVILQQYKKSEKLKLNK
jgi:hypothetical protein